MERVSKKKIKVRVANKVNKNTLPAEERIYIPPRYATSDYRIGKNKNGEYFYYIDIKSDLADPNYEYYMQSIVNPDAGFVDFLKDIHVYEKMTMDIYKGFYRFTFIPHFKPKRFVAVIIAKIEKVSLKNKNETCASTRAKSDLDSLCKFMNSMESESEETKVDKEYNNNEPCPPTVVISVPELNPLFMETSKWHRDKNGDKFTYWIEIQNDNIYEKYSYKASIYYPSDGADKDYVEEKSRAFNCIASISSFDGYAKIKLNEGVQCIDSVDVELEPMV